MKTYVSISESGYVSRIKSNSQDEAHENNIDLDDGGNCIIIPLVDARRIARLILKKEGK